MFTGIITSQAVLREKKKAKGGTCLTFEALGRILPFRLGQSVAADGVCVTIAAFRGKRFSVDLIEETLRSTTLGPLSAGERVNLERALRVGDELGGHWVTGHVDGMGMIRRIERRGAGLRLEIAAPPEIFRRLTPKGSVAINGISFTVQEIHRNSFEVGVTPHTFQVTTLPLKREGSRVNLEADLFAKLAEEFFSKRNRRSSFTIKTLQAQGF